MATLEVGKEPGGLALTPDGTYAYVANYNEGSAGTVSVIDTASAKVVATVPVGAGPSDVAIVPPPSR